MTSNEWVKHASYRFYELRQQFGIPLNAKQDWEWACCLANKVRIFRKQTVWDDDDIVLNDFEHKFAHHLKSIGYSRKSSVDSGCTGY